MLALVYIKQDRCAELFQGVTSLVFADIIRPVILLLFPEFILSLPGQMMLALFKDCF